jgi:hypothetical protein
LAFTACDADRFRRGNTVSLSKSGELQFHGEGETGCHDGLPLVRAESFDFRGAIRRLSSALSSASSADNETVVRKKK